MTVKERADFLVQRYGDKCIDVITSLIEDNTDAKTISYWKDVLKTCKEVLKNKKTNVYES
jgi:hypothetical protein